jgi:type II secretory pathway component PulK
MRNLISGSRGNALAFVMLTLLLVFFMVSIVVSIAQTNIRQASAQERGMQAYYIARSGAELAYEALLTTTPSLLHDDSAECFESNPAMVLVQNGIDFEDGKADVRVTSSGSGAGQKIRIESVGTLNENSISRTVTLEFYINYDQYPDMVWSK